MISVIVEGTQEKHVLVIKIQDTGIGISEKDRQKLLKPFGKVSNQALNPEGVGLGLQISHMLALNLGPTSYPKETLGI